jgi:hypothetical protein
LHAYGDLWLAADSLIIDSTSALYAGNSTQIVH